MTSDYSQPASASLILAVGLICYAFVVSKNIFTLWLLWKFWNHDEVKVRGRILTLIFHVGYFGGETLLTTFVCSGRNQSFDGFRSIPMRDWSPSIWFGVLLEPYITSLWIGPLVLKSMILMFKLQIAREQLSLADKKSTLPTQSLLWFSTHRHWVSERNQFYMIVMWTVWCFVPYLCAFSTSILSSFLLAAEGVLLSLMLAYCGMRINRSKMDFWKLKEEIYSYVIGWTLALVTGGSISYVIWNVLKNVHFSWRLLFLYVGVFFVCQCFISPVSLKALLNLYGQEKHKDKFSKFSTDADFAFSSHRSRQMEARHEGLYEHDDTFPEFLNKYKENLFFQLLSRQDFEEPFKQHLASEFSLENMLFFTEVRRLYERCGELSNVFGKSDNITVGVQLEELLLEAAQICNSFLYPDSLSALNISYKSREKAVSSFENILKAHKESSSFSMQLLVDLSQAFLPAADEVFLVMQNDSFRRFKTTKAYAILHSKYVAIAVVQT